MFGVHEIKDDLDHMPTDDGIPRGTSNIIAKCPWEEGVHLSSEEGYLGGITHDLSYLSLAHNLLESEVATPL